MKYSAFLVVAVLAAFVSVPAFASSYHHLPNVNVNANIANVRTNVSSFASSGDNVIRSRAMGVQNSIVTGSATAILGSEINVNSLVGPSLGYGIEANVNYANVRTRLDSSATSGGNLISTRSTPMVMEVSRHHMPTTPVSGGINYIGTGAAGSEVMSMVNVNKIGL